MFTMPVATTTRSVAARSRPAMSGSSGEAPIQIVP
jgi:hypothetical protein